MTKSQKPNADLRMKAIAKKHGITVSELLERVRPLFKNPAILQPKVKT